jgi:hypothetical protein
MMQTICELRGTAMRKLGCIWVLTAMVLTPLAATALGQAGAKRTDVHGYSLGESFRDFSLQLGFDTSVCHGKAKLTKMQKNACKEVAQVEAGKPLATEAAQPGCEAQNPDGAMVDSVGRSASEVTSPCIDPYHFLFEYGKLVLISFHVPDFAQAVAEATAKYGRPAEQSTVTLKDVWGLASEVGRARWNMPDGAVVTLVEDIVDRVRSTEVTVCTAEKRKQLDAETQKNPF